MTQYEITFIIPLYNVGKYIARCCNALLPQCGEDIEVIFIDDCSADDSLRIIKEIIARDYHFHSNIKVEVNNENLGVAASRQKGLEEAQGRYIGFVDADDFVAEDFISSLRKAIAGDYDMIGWNWRIKFPNGEKYIEQPHLSDATEAFESMISGETRWYLWSFLVRKEIILRNNICFIKGADVAEDMSYLLKSLACARSYYNIPKSLYAYSKENENAVTHKSIEYQIRQAEKNLESIESFLIGRLGREYQEKIEFIRLNVKLPLLISTNKSDYDLWRSIFVSANSHIWKNKRQSFRNKLLQTAAMYHLDFFVKAYSCFYQLCFRLIYGKR